MACAINHNLKSVILDGRVKLCYYTKAAGVVEQADTRDLKSLAVKSVPVRSRSPAPKKKHPIGVLFLWYREVTGIEPIQMQMPGGHLLAAGLDGGNTMIKSIPSPAHPPSGCFFFGIGK